MANWYPGMLLNYILSLISPNPPVGGIPETPVLPLPEPVPTPLPEPQHVFNPQADFQKPALWKYYPDETYDIWFAGNYKEYIIPHNEIVMYFIDHIKFIERGGMLLVKFKSNNSHVDYKYRKDDGRLCSEAGQSNQECNELMDFWLNPDYYIWYEFEGDCEDYALLWGSVFENLGIPYMIVGGYAGSERDWWVEVIYNGTKYMGQVQRYGGTFAGIDHGMFKPYIMFNKSTDIQPYEEWYKDSSMNQVRRKAILVG